VTGQAADEFTKQFNAVFGSSQQPLANANYAYDSVISVALAADQAQSIKGADVNANMKKVTNPPGTQCYTYKTCLDLINKGTKINYDGASGDLNYNQYNNVFGPYGAFRVDASSGQEQQLEVLSAPDLAAATP